MSCLCPVCRFCVFKRFRRTTTMNSCIQSSLRWVGRLCVWSVTIMFIAFYDNDVFMLLLQATPACTSGVPGLRQMAVLPAIVAVASLSYQSPHWSSSGLRQSCWTGTTLASFCCFSQWSPGGQRLRPRAHPSVWPTPTCSSTPGGVM